MNRGQKVLFGLLLAIELGAGIYGNEIWLMIVGAGGLLMLATGRL